MKRSDPVRIVDGNQQVVITESGELLISETEREYDVWAQYSATLDTDDTYVILISLNDNRFPHKRQGQNGTRIDITSAYYAVTLAINTDAIVRIGVITRIDGTNADIKYFAGLPFLAGAIKLTVIDSLRGTPSQVKTDFNNIGALLHGITNNKENNVAAVNTSVSLDSPAGNISPGLGDIVLKYEESVAQSSINFAIFLFYHNTD